MQALQTNQGSGLYILRGQCLPGLLRVNWVNAQQPFFPLLLASLDVQLFPDALNDLVRSQSDIHGKDIIRFFERGKLAGQ